MGGETSALHAYILCGGQGRRIWPLSTADTPKQFQKLNSDKTLFEETLARLEYLAPDRLRVVASQYHRDRIHDLGRGFALEPDDMLFEPAPRNTAAAIALATIDATRSGEDPFLLITPSDHAISTDRAFKQCVTSGMEAASGGNIVLFGIRPDRVETGFGYIEIVEGDDDVQRVVSFHEKPDQYAAISYNRTGRHFWNSGIFLARASVLAGHFEELQPKIWDGVKAALSQSAGSEINARLYATIPDISFDKAIVENAESVVMVPAAFSWSDLGSWQALQGAGRAAENGNILSGAVADDCQNSLLSGNGIKIAAHGLSDIVLVAKPDIVYAAPVSKAHRLGELFEQSPDFQTVQEKPNSERLAQWLTEEALPYWASNGADWEYGGFHEHLTFQGKAKPSNKRLRTMARQTWAFSEAARRNLHPKAEEIAEHGMSFLQDYARVGGGGFASAFTAQGDIVDPVFRLYDHAMVLLACSSLHHIDPTRASILGVAVLNQLERGFSLTRKSGYREIADETDFHQTANAHMHLLDALDAWTLQAGDTSTGQLASDLRTLFVEEIYDPAEWIARESFAIKGPKDENTTWSPGHHYEWICLLLRHQKNQKRRHVEIARQLWSKAKSWGTTPNKQLARLELSADNATASLTSRSWAQFEIIRAIIALKPHNLPAFDDELQCAIERLFNVHIDPAPPGGWVDEVDDTGRGLSDSIPASIFYHAFRSVTAVVDQPSVR